MITSPDNSDLRHLKERLKVKHHAGPPMGGSTSVSAPSRISSRLAFQTVVPFRRWAPPFHLTELTLRRTPAGASNGGPYGKNARAIDHRP